MAGHNRWGVCVGRVGGREGNVLTLPPSMPASALEGRRNWLYISCGGIPCEPSLAGWSYVSCGGIPCEPSLAGWSYVSCGGIPCEPNRAGWSYVSCGGIPCEPNRAGWSYVSCMTTLVLRTQVHRTGELVPQAASRKYSHVHWCCRRGLQTCCQAGCRPGPSGDGGRGGAEGVTIRVANVG